MNISRKGSRKMVWKRKNMDVDMWWTSWLTLTPQTIFRKRSGQKNWILTFMRLVVSFVFHYPLPFSRDRCRLPSQSVLTCRAALPWPGFPPPLLTRVFCRMFRAVWDLPAFQGPMPNPRSPIWTLHSTLFLGPCNFCFAKRSPIGKTASGCATYLI